MLKATLPEVNQQHVRHGSADGCSLTLVAKPVYKVMLYKEGQKVFETGRQLKRSSGV